MTTGPHRFRGAPALAALLATLWLVHPETPAHAHPQETAAAQEEDRQEEEERSDETRSVSERLNYSEQVVVSASRVEQEIVNAPAAVTVINAEQIETQASSNFGDLVRQAPGVNVTQLSNRDINVTSRSPAGTLATSQLVMVDGRSVYQDFFGFVAWDMISVGMDDLERVEVVNGPASAIWGANALSGVVNLITRAPRDYPGTTLDLRFGSFDRNVPGRDMDPGSFLSGTLTHAQAVSDSLAYRLTVGFSQQQAFARPAGNIPNDFQTPYPEIETPDTRNPKVDFRLDWGAPDSDSEVRLSGGYAGSQGLLHSGLGPFQIQPGSGMAYGRVQYLRGSMEIGAFVNSTSTEFNASIVRHPDGELLYSHMNSNTFDFSIRDTRLLGGRHLLSYGANARAVTLDFGLGPDAQPRNEQGIYVSDEIFLSDRFRWIVGVRADRLSVLEDIVVSPRTTLIFKPTPRNALRVSYNRAFRAPSMTNNYLDVDVGAAAEFDLRPAFRSFFPGLSVPDESLPKPVLFTIPFTAIGNRDLVSETLTAYEVGWSGALNDWVGASVAVYRNEKDQVMDFTDHLFWSATDAPPGWNEAFAEVQDFVAQLSAALPPGVIPESVAAIGQNPGYLIPLLEALAGVQLPKVYTYVNRDYVNNTGIEVGLNARRGRFGGYVNYSWQSEPDAGGFVGDDADEINRPAAHRVNAGADAHFGRVHFGTTFSYTGRGYWTDVLSPEYHGWTEAFSMVNATLSVDLLDGHLRPSIRVMNLLNDDIQQHVFGDVIKRQVIGQLRYRF